MGDYLTGELAADVSARFEQHLSVCSNCVKYLTGYKATIELGRAAFDAGDATVPAEVPADLVNAILSARR
jgi:anti-sigma factor RsiW